MCARDGKEEKEEEESEVINQSKVWNGYTIQQCYDTTGKGPISVKWADALVGNDETPESRCGDEKTPESRCGDERTPESRCGDEKAPERRCMMFLGTSRARCDSPATREIRFQLPPERCVESYRLKLMRFVQRFNMDTLIFLTFVTDVVNADAARYETQFTMLVYCCDDYVVWAAMAGPIQFKDAWEKRMTVKIRSIMSMGSGGTLGEIRLLDHIIMIKFDEARSLHYLDFEADLRHCVVWQKLGLWNAKPISRNHCPSMPNGGHEMGVISNDPSPSGRPRQPIWIRCPVCGEFCHRFCTCRWCRCCPQCCDCPDYEGGGYDVQHWRHLRVRADSTQSLKV